MSKPRQAKSKKSRYKETIISLPDGEAKTWAREALEKIAAKEMGPGRKGDALTKIKRLLDRPGLLQPTTRRGGKRKGEAIAPLLTDKEINAWWEGVQALAVNREEFNALLAELGIARERVPDAKVETEFAGKEKRTFAPKSLIGFIRKHCGVSKEEVPDARVEDLLAARAGRAELRGRSIKAGKPGQPIRSIRREQDRMAFSAAHLTPDGKAKIGGVKAIDNSSSITYLRREIWVGVRTVGKKTKIEYQRRLIPHPRHLAAHEKMHGEKWKSEPLGEGMKKVCEFAVGDLLRVPLDQRGKMVKRGASFAEQDARFYRVAALKTKGDVKLKLAEFDEPKIPKDKKASHMEETLLACHEIVLTADEELAWLHEFTTGQKVELPVPIPAPPPADRPPGIDELL